MKKTYTIQFTAEKENYEDIFDFIKDSAEILSNKIQRKKRSNKQNRALHLWLTMASQQAQEQGLTLDVLYSKPTEMRITEEHIKTFTKDVVKSITQKHNKTSKLTTEEFKILEEILGRVFARRLNFTEPFPNIKDLRNK